MSYLSNSINAATMGLRLAASGGSPLPRSTGALPTAQELTTGSNGTGKVNWMLVVGGLVVGGGLLWLLLRRKKKSSRRDEED